MSNWHDRHRTAYDREHERELRKHDTLPSRLSPPIAGAMEVALIVKGLDNVITAAGLIEQYAQTIAAAARLDGVEATIRRFDEAYAEASHAKA